MLLLFFFFFIIYCVHAAQTELLLVGFKKLLGLYSNLVSTDPDFKNTSLMSSLFPTEHLQPTMNWLHIDTFCVRPYFVSILKKPNENILTLNCDSYYGENVMVVEGVQHFYH